MYTTTEQSSQTFGNFENREDIKTQEEQKQESESEGEQQESGAGDYPKEPDTAEDFNGAAEKYFSDQSNDTQLSDGVEPNTGVNSMKTEEPVKYVSLNSFKMMGLYISY